MQNCRRKHARVKFELQCNLNGNNGESYDVLLDDMSLNGASVKIDVVTTFQVGDSCELLLSKRSVALPVKRMGKIIRITSGFIGIAFNQY